MASRGIELAFSLVGKLSPDFVKSAQSATSHLAAVKKEAAAVERSANNRAAKKAWKEFSSSARDAKKAVSGVKNEISGVVKAAAGLALGKGLVGGAIYGVAKSSAGYADNVIKSAQGVGMTTEAYSELAYAAQMAGASEEQFGKASLKMNGLLMDAAAGKESALRIFERAQIDPRDEAGKLKTVEQLWGDFANKFASMKDGEGKTNLAKDMLGDKLAAKMIPFLNGAKKGMDEAREAAKQMGISLSEQDGINAEAFNDSFANIKASMRGVSLVAGKHLWPVFTKIHDFISNKILQAGQELAKKMPEWTEKFEEGWNALVPELEKAWESIKSGAIWIDGIAQGMGGWIPLIKSVIKGWLIWRGIRLTKSLINTYSSVKKLSRSFLELQHNGSSIGGVFHALGGKLKGLFNGSDAIPKEGLKPFSGSLRTALKSAFRSAYATAGNGAKGLGRHTKNILLKSFDGVSAAAKGIGKGAVFVGGGLKGIGKSAGGGIKSFFKSIPGMARTAGTAVRGFSSATWSGVQAAASFSKTLVVSTGKGIAGFASTIAVKALPMLSGMATALYAGAAAALKFGVALLANPIGLAIAGIVALGAAIYLCVKHWDRIKAAVSAAWETVKGIFVSGWNLLPDWIQEPLSGMAGAIGNFGKKVWSGIVKDWEGIKGAFSDAWAGIVNIATSFGSTLKDGFSAIWSGISGIFSERFDKIGEAFENSFIGGLLETLRQFHPLALFKDAFSAVSKWLFNFDLSEALGNVWNSVIGYFTEKGGRVVEAFDQGIMAGLWEAVKQFSPLSLFIDAFTAVKDWIMGFDLASAGAELARKLGDGILNAWAGIKDGIKSAVVDWIPGGGAIVNAVGGAADAVSGAYNTVAGWFGGGTEAAAAAATLPAYANGGIVTSPQVALIGEAGPEVVVPLSRPARARELLGQAAGMMGQAGGWIGEQAAPVMNLMQDAASPVVRLLNSVAGSVFNNSVTNSAMSNTATASYWPQTGMSAAGLGSTAGVPEVSNIARLVTENQSVNNVFSAASNVFGGDKAASTNNTVNQSWLSTVAGATNTRLGDMISSVKTAFTGGDVTNSYLTATGGAAGDVLQNVFNNISNAGRWIDNAVTQTFPAYANGGLVTAPQMALVGEAGPEMIIPLTRENRARDLMGSAAEFMGWESGGGERGGDTFEFTFSPVIHVTGGDGGVVRQIERVLDSKANDMRRQFDDWWRDMQRQESRTGNR